MAKSKRTLATSPVEADDYGALFAHYLLRRTTKALMQIEATDVPLVEELRAQALCALDFALDSSEAQTVAAKLLLAMAPRMEQAGFRDAWIDYLERGIELRYTAEDRLVKAELLFQLGFLYQLRARYDDAESRLLQSMADFASLQRADRQAAVNFRLAYVYRLQRNYEKARQAIEKGFALVESDNPVCAHGYYLRGLFAYDDSDYETAIQEYQQSLKLYTLVSNQQMIALRLGNIGLAYSEWGKYQEATTYYNQSIRMFEEQQDVTRIATMKMNLGNIHLLLNEPNAALALYQQAEPIFRAAGDELHLTHLYVNQGIAYRLAGQWQTSEQFLSNALERWRHLNDINSLVNVLDELAQLYVAQGLSKKARSVLLQALEWLKQIDQQPGFRRLHERVTKRLNQLPSGRK